jgi:thiamine-phosphate pyrophosphorylase
VSFRFPSPLYAIADPCGRSDSDVVALGRALLAGGAQLVQLRWKDAPAGRLLEAASALRVATREAGAILVVNDRVDVALAVGADAVHLGQDDLPLGAARLLAGARLAIGVSTHDVRQAEAAAGQGADYVAFGPVYETATKATGYTPRGLELLAAVRAAVDIPLVAIGGIRAANAAEPLAAGADAVAMISDLALAPEPAAAVRAVLAVLSRLAR